jgi:hypothetical protein
MSGDLRGMFVVVEKIVPYQLLYPTYIKEHRIIGANYRLIPMTSLLPILYIACAMVMS